MVVKVNLTLVKEIFLFLVNCAFAFKKKPGIRLSVMRGKRKFNVFFSAVFAFKIVSNSPICDVW